MLLVCHVLIALGSVAFSTYLFFWPSLAKVRVSYGLVAATLTSGTALVVFTQTAVLRACLSGLVYVGVVSVIIAAAQHRLSTASQKF